jgi:D-alanine transaminase
MPAISYLNGIWQPPEEARIPVLDRGFLFGDGIYEVIPVYNGKAFALSRHLRRLHNGLQEVGVANPMTDAEWENLVNEAIVRSAERTAFLYLQVTRGVAAKRDHRYPEKAIPTVLVMVYEAPILARTEIVPLQMITLDDFRWERGHIKATSLIAAGMLKNHALAQGMDDAILVKYGRVTEATSANVFIANGEVLATPPKSNRLLHGITRDLVLELARAQGICADECDITEEQLQNADEIFITSSGYETWPVGTLNGRVIGTGRGGPLWRRIDKLFQDFKSRGN